MEKIIGNDGNVKHECIGLYLKSQFAWDHQRFESCLAIADLFIKDKNVKWSRYRPGVAQRVGRGIALLFHDRSTRRGWVVSSTPRPHFRPGKDPVPIFQEAGWAPGPVWTSGKSRPHRNSIPDRPARSSVAIPTELPGPQICLCMFIKVKRKDQ